MQGVHNLAAGVLMAVASLLLWSPVALASGEGGGAATGAGALQTALDAAKESMARGDFTQAAQQYHQLYQQGYQGADICYNTGTAYLKSGRIGPGVLFLKRALLQDPGNDDTRFNLSFAMDAIAHTAATARDAANAEDGGLTVQAVVEAVSLDAWTWLFLAGAWSLALSLVLLLVLRGRKRLITGLAAVLLLVFAGFGGSMLHLKAQDTVYTEHAVVQSLVEVKEGPHQRFDTVFPVAEGVTVRVEERIDDWLRVSLPNGLGGFVPRSSVEVI